MNGNFLEITLNMKKPLLEKPVMDVILEGQTSPLMNTVQRTSSSLPKSFETGEKKILYPDLT